MLLLIIEFVFPFAQELLFMARKQMKMCCSFTWQSIIFSHTFCRLMKQNHAFSSSSSSFSFVHSNRLLPIWQLIDLYRPLFVSTSLKTPFTCQLRIPIVWSNFEYWLIKMNRIEFIDWQLISIDNWTNHTKLKRDVSCVHMTIVYAFNMYICNWSAFIYFVHGYWHFYMIWLWPSE